MIINDIFQLPLDFCPICGEKLKYTKGWETNECKNEHYYHEKGAYNIIVGDFGLYMYIENPNQIEIYHHDHILNDPNIIPFVALDFSDMSKLEQHIKTLINFS